jgi:AcrR family transcriptional regulator
MGIAERREREKEQRRNTILDAAEKVFFSKGINLATMEEVAEEAELSKGTLYLYFDSKEELFLGIACRALTLLKRMFEEAVNSKPTGLQKVRAIGEAHFHYSQKYPHYFNMVVHYESSQIDKVEFDSMLQQCHQLGKGVMEVVVGAVVDGLKDGSLRSDLDPVRTAYLLRGLSAGIIQLISREKKHIEELEEFEAKDLMEDFMDMMFYAIRSNGVKH